MAGAKFTNFYFLVKVVILSGTNNLQQANLKKLFVSYPSAG